MAPSDFFKVTGLSCAFGKKVVLRDISFSLAAGSLTGLLGANGSGKSSLLKTLCGFCGSAEVSLDGQRLNLKKRRPLARKISYIPQRSGVALALPVTEVVAMGLNPRLSLLERPGAAHRHAVESALKALGLWETRDQNFLTLSEGQKQLVILARTLVQDTPVMLLDEPDSALDFNNRRLLLKQISALSLQQDKAALLCSHDPALALEFCHRLLLLKDGQILADLNPAADSEAALGAALSQIYGPLTVFRHRGRLFIYKEENL